MGMRSAEGARIKHSRERIVVSVFGAPGDLIEDVLSRDWLADNLKRLNRLRAVKSGWRFAAQLGGGGVNRVEDGDIARAAAECIFEGDLHIIVSSVGVLIEQTLGSHNQARRAESALDCAMLDKAALEWVKNAVFGKPFDGLHRCTLRLEGGIDARIDGFPIDDDRAGAAFGLFAADLGAGEAQIVTKDLG